MILPYPIRVKNEKQIAKIHNHLFLHSSKNPPKTPPSIHSKLYFQNFQKKVKINLELSTKML